MEIGTSDFDTLIQTCADTAVGLSIDPIRYYLDRLPNRPNVTKINAAVSDSDGTVLCYHVPDAKIQQYQLPWWVRGCNSIGAPHPTVRRVIAESGLEESALVESFSIPKISFPTLIRDHNIRSINYLKTDTEGHDCVILASYMDAVRDGLIPPAKKILFESNVLTSRTAVSMTIGRLIGMGYEVISTGGDDTVVEYRG